MLQYSRISSDPARPWNDHRGVQLWGKIGDEGCRVRDTQILPGNFVPGERVIIKTHINPE